MITTGTFLRGVIHIGSQTRAAGRLPSPDAVDTGSDAAAQTAATALATTLHRLGFECVHPSLCKHAPLPRKD